MGTHEEIELADVRLELGQLNRNEVAEQQVVLIIEIIDAEFLEITGDDVAGLLA